MTGTPRHSFYFSAYILIAILAIQGIGWFAAWQIMRWEAQNAARMALANTETPVFKITITAGQLAQLRVDEHEIRWQDKLCDIKSAVYHADSLTLTLYYDHYEEAVWDQLWCLFESEDTIGQRHLRIALAKWLSILFLVAHPADWLLVVPAPANQSNFLPHLLTAQYAPRCYYPPPK